MGGDGESSFYEPCGKLIPIAPPQPALAANPAARDAEAKGSVDDADPVVVLTRSNWATGVTIDAETSLPDWQGEELDLALAIGTLRSDLTAPPGDVN